MTTGKRVITDADVKRYVPLVEMYLKKNVLKNWNEAQLHNAGEDRTLGNTGMSIDDIRQQLLTEVCVALHKYKPDYRTKDGKSVKEITFVYTHIYNRCGQLMKRLVSKGRGYGVWMQNIEETFDHFGEDVT